MLEVFKIMAREHLALATGHATPENTLLWIREARKMGIDRIIVTHPINRMSLEQQQEAAKMGAYLEYCYGTTLEYAGKGRRTLDEYAKLMKALGPEHCIMSSDLGNAVNPVHPAGIKSYIAGLLEAGSRKSMSCCGAIRPACWIWNSAILLGGPVAHVVPSGHICGVHRRFLVGTHPTSRLNGWSPEFHCYRNPVRNRDGSDMPAFAHQFDDGPALLSLPEMFDRQTNNFRTPKPTTEKKCLLGWGPRVASGLVRQPHATSEFPRSTPSLFAQKIRFALPIAYLRPFSSGRRHQRPRRCLKV